jgi:hypothetical protein
LLTKISNGIFKKEMDFEKLKLYIISMSYCPKFALSFDENCGRYRVSISKLSVAFYFELDNSSRDRFSTNSRTERAV